MSSAARAERRRQERAAAKARTLYHGTSAVLVDQIKREGLRLGTDGRVFLTDSKAIARSYAVWEAARQAAQGATPDPDTPSGRRALALGGNVGAVFTVKATVPIAVEQDSYPPPLPWETTMLKGVSYFATRPIAAEHLGPVEMWSIAELDDPAQVEAVCRESILVCGALHRRDSVSPTAPMLRRSSIHKAIPDIWVFHEGVMQSSTNARSRWHGETHWRGVLAAAVRLVERGSQADPAILLAFCLLHDSRRSSEGYDPKHGERAAQLADLMHDHEILTFTDEQRATLRAALVDHDRGKTSTDPTIGACWDADRLTLGRVGITINPAMLSTAQGRALAAEPGSVPAGEACDWDWALSRMYLLAAGAARVSAAAA